MIFSTAVSGTGNTLNQGLAVDAAGNVYLTGLAGAGYPYTVNVLTAPSGPALPNLATPALPFLTKLDPAGQKLVYSVPVGGAGVQLDSQGLAYVGGVLGLSSNYDVAATLPALANLPSTCLLPAVTVGRSAYVAQVDGSGNVLGTQFIGGSSLAILGVSLSSATLWVTGSTSLPDFPFSAGALMSPNLKPRAAFNQSPGAYLGAVNFSAPQPAAGTPQIGCLVDSADLEPAGPVVPHQLLTILGSGLGPTTPSTATDNSTTTLGGVSVSFGSLAAPLLYVSSNQINLAVPMVSEEPAGTAMQVTVNGVSSPPVLLPVTSANPSLFVVPGSFGNFREFEAVALNSDGTLNSAGNPAQLGSVISVFVNGLPMDPQVLSGPLQLLAAEPGWSVTSVAQVNPYVLQVNLQIPSTNANFECPAANTSACAAEFQVDDLNSFLSAPQPGSAGGLSFAGVVYVAQ